MLVPARALSFAGLRSDRFLSRRVVVCDGFMTHHAGAVPSITVKRRCAEDIIMQETELKLEPSRSGAGSLLKKNPFGSSTSILQQRSIYFDPRMGSVQARPVASHSAIGK